MMTKTIKISEKTHELLSELASKNETFNDVIDFLINYYYENEEFSDEQADPAKTLGHGDHKEFSKACSFADQRNQEERSGQQGNPIIAGQHHDDHDAAHQP